MPESSALPELPIEEPLGLKSPLLPHRPLGQPMLSPQFLVPLGTQSLTTLDPSLFTAEAWSDNDVPDQSFDSPFLTRSPQSIQRQSANPPLPIANLSVASSPINSSTPLLEDSPETSSQTSPETIPETSSEGSPQAFPEISLDHSSSNSSGNSSGTDILPDQSNHRESLSTSNHSLSEATPIQRQANSLSNSHDRQVTTPSSSQKPIAQEHGQGPVNAFSSHVLSDPIASHQSSELLQTSLQTTQIDLGETVEPNTERSQTANAAEEMVVTETVIPEIQRFSEPDAEQASQVTIADQNASDPSFTTSTSESVSSTASANPVSHTVIQPVIQRSEAVEATDSAAIGSVLPIQLPNIQQFSEPEFSSDFIHSSSPTEFSETASESSDRPTNAITPDAISASTSGPSHSNNSLAIQRQAFSESTPLSEPAAASSRPDSTESPVPTQSSLLSGLELSSDARDETSNAETLSTPEHFTNPVPSSTPDHLLQLAPSLSIAAQPGVDAIGSDQHEPSTHLEDRQPTEAATKIAESTSPESAPISRSTELHNPSATQAAIDVQPQSDPVIQRSIDYQTNSAPELEDVSISTPPLSSFSSPSPSSSPSSPSSPSISSTPLTTSIASSNSIQRYPVASESPSHNDPEISSPAFSTEPSTPTSTVPDSTATAATPKPVTSIGLPPQAIAPELEKTAVQTTPIVEATALNSPGNPLVQREPDPDVDTHSTKASQRSAIGLSSEEAELTDPIATTAEPNTDIVIQRFSQPVVSELPTQTTSTQTTVESITGENSTPIDSIAELQSSVEPTETSDPHAIGPHVNPTPIPNNGQPVIQQPVIQQPVVQQPAIQKLATQQPATQPQITPQIITPTDDTRFIPTPNSLQQPIQRQVTSPSNETLSSPSVTPSALEHSPPETTADPPAIEPHPSVSSPALNTSETATSELETSPIIQAKPAQNFPKLPTVLTNLSTVQPLLSPQALVSSDRSIVSPTDSSTAETPIPETASIVSSDAPVRSVEPTNGYTNLMTQSSLRPSRIQRRVAASISELDSQRVEETPDSWSSIQDLLNSTSPTQRSHSNSSPIQRLISELEDPPQLDQISSTMQSPIAAQAETQTAPAMILDAAMTTSSEAEISSGAAAGNTAGQRSSQGDTEKLETLAREIYGLLRQRLEIERERQGNFFHARTW